MAEPPVPLYARTRAAFSDLQARARSRLDTALAERQARWQRQAGLPPASEATEEDPRPFSPRGIQGNPAFYQPGDDWSQWQVCPSTGGRSGQRMSDVARHNPELRLMEVKFSSGGQSGTGNVYQYAGVSEVEFINFLSGRLGGGRTYPVLDPRSGQQLYAGRKVG